MRIPCEFCDDISASFPLHKKHVKENHEGKEVNFDCKVQECDFYSFQPDGLLNHYAEEHVEHIKEKMEEINSARSTFLSVPEI